jgi:PIN domain nuclease of toxin-antitoxin system
VAEVVVDTSAVMARVLREAGAERVEAVLSGAWLSAVNLAEVAEKLTELGVGEREAEDLVRRLDVRIEGFDAGAAFRVGFMRGPTRAAGLSLGDRACLDLARSRRIPAYTADRAWTNVDVGVEVVLIR